MNREQVEQKYLGEGLITEYVQDEAGKLYKPHRHELTKLHTLKGSVSIKIEDGEWQKLQPGQEFIVGSNLLHEAKVGPEGWEYVAAWNEEEAAQFNH